MKDIKFYVTLLTIGFSLALNTRANAQDSLLIGKWQLVEMQQDSIIVFNRDSAELIIEAGRAKQKTLDSLELKKYIEITHPMMKKMYYQFLDNSELLAGVLDLNDGNYYFVEKQGGYYIDGNKIGISVSGGIDSYVYRIEGNMLTLIPIIDGEIYTRGYAKYERVN